MIRGVWVSRSHRWRLSLPHDTKRRRNRAPPAPLSAAATPRITVAVCSYNRYDYLSKAIASVVSQSLPAEQYRIIVVDNSPDAAFSQNFSQNFAEIQNLRWAHETTPGLSHARNVALSLCETPLIAYLDDDAVACREWLFEKLKAFDELGAETVAIGGRVVPVFSASRPEWLTDSLLSYLSVLELGDTTRLITTSEWVVGANLSYRVDAVRAVGGFNTALGRVGSGASLMSNDETELEGRLRAAGGLVGYSPRASVEHHIAVERITQSWFRRRIAWQAVSDYVRSPETMRDQASGQYLELKKFFASCRPADRTVRGLFLDEPNGDRLAWQMMSIYGTIISILAGSSEIDDV